MFTGAKKSGACPVTCGHKSKIRARGVKGNTRYVTATMRAIQLVIFSLMLFAVRCSSTLLEGGKITVIVYVNREKVRYTLTLEKSCERRQRQLRKEFSKPEDKFFFNAIYHKEGRGEPEFEQEWFEEDIRRNTMEKVENHFVGEFKKGTFESEFTRGEAVVHIQKSQADSGDTIVSKQPGIILSVERAYNDYDDTDKPTAEFTYEVEYGDNTTDDQVQEVELERLVINSDDWENSGETDSEKWEKNSSKRLYDEELKEYTCKGPNCGRKFGRWMRLLVVAGRHHCRLCGRVACKKCLTSDKYLKWKCKDKTTCSTILRYWQNQNLVAQEKKRWE